MLAREPEAPSFGFRMEREVVRLTSAIAVWEACRGLARARGLDFAEARSIVTDFLSSFGVTIVAIEAAEAEGALDAHQRYGKGRHVAALNMGDCFSYACATRNDAELLFKGEDFVHTDVKDATLS